MSKKIITAVDEKAVMDMMGVNGVVTSHNQNVPAPVATTASVADTPAPQDTTVENVAKNNNLPTNDEDMDVEETATMTTIPSAEKPMPTKKKKERQGSYDDIFLHEKRIKIPCAMHIDMETHKRLQRIVRLVFDNEISLSNFVDNILVHHLDKYNDELKQRLESKTFEL